MNRVFYDVANNREIVDVSGSKTLAEIKKQFGDVEYAVLDVGPDEVVSIVKGKAVKRGITDPRTPEDKLIESKKQVIIERLAIAELKQEGKLPADFNRSR